MSERAKRIRPIRQCSRCLEMRPYEALGLCRRCYRRDYDRENQLLRRAQRQATYARHREQIKAKNRAYYHANREACRAQQREYRNRGGAVSASYGSEVIKRARLLALLPYTAHDVGK
jgi:hypothetical protein